MLKRYKEDIDSFSKEDDFLTQRQIKYLIPRIEECIGISVPMSVKIQYAEDGDALAEEGKSKLSVLELIKVVN